jgi:acyl-CoA thioesterase
MAAIDSLLRAFALEATGPDRYRVEPSGSGSGVVFGGQLVGQTIVAGLAGHDGKTVKTVHTIFARGATPDAPLEIAVDRMHAGRTFASSTVTIYQGERLCTRSLVLLCADEPDFIRHGDPLPAVPGPAECAAAGLHVPGWEVRIVGGVDISDPENVGPPQLDVWNRFPDAPDDSAIDQALIAFATDGFLIGTAMRPHAGVGQAQAHRTVSTGVLSHTLTFHEPCPAQEWFLLSQRSSYSGHGRCYGHANVFRADGTLVAAFVQDGMIRPLQASASGRAL